MSIFVDPNALIPIEVQFRILKNDSGQVVGVNIIEESNETQPDEMRIVCEAKGRDYGNMSAILEEVTVINHISSQPMIRSKLFRCMILEKFFVRWNVKDEDGNMVQINRENINKMFYGLVKELTNQWLSKTSS